MNYIDLHVHTTASDSTASPSLAVEIAAENKIAAIAVTDHDNAGGCEEAMRRGKELGVEVVPGIEISTKYGVSVHILGYYMNMNDRCLKAKLRSIVDDRDERNRRVTELMAADGIPVTYEEMQRRFGDVIGRPHFGQILVENGLCTDVKDAFQHYVGKGMRYYVPRHIIPLDEAVRIIADAGGIPVLAHPFQYKKDDSELRELIDVCMDNGLMGMECFYSGYGPEQTAYLEALAREYRLLVTGGSDFHGENKPYIHLGSGRNGELRVPYSLLEELKKHRKF